MDMSRYKVLYQNAIYRCVALIRIPMQKVPELKSNEECATGIFPAKGMIELLALNEDGELIFLHDEAWCFQFFKLT